MFSSHTSVIPFATGAARPAATRLGEMISALSYALDLTEGQPMGHGVNSCLLGMRIAAELNVTGRDLYDLYFALLLKDTGCSSNAERMFEVFGGDDLQAKREVKMQDWTRVNLEGLRYLTRNMKAKSPAWERVVAIGQMAIHREKRAKEFTSIRCERGAQIAMRLGFSPKTAQAIRNLDELWNGKGYPKGIRGDLIPVGSRIMNLAQTLEVFASTESPKRAMEVARQRSGAWFDPVVVKAAEPLEKDAALWKSLRDGSARAQVIALEPGDSQSVTPATVDTICEAFASIIDAKSHFNRMHSTRVAETAGRIGRVMGFDEPRLTRLRRAALLHDLGKLSIPNSLVDKSGKLSADDREVIEMYPQYTQAILDMIPGFQEIAIIAGDHHERLDGSGYPHKRKEKDLSPDSRALAIADMYDALISPRAHRPAMPRAKALEEIAREVPARLDPFCFKALQRVT